MFSDDLENESSGNWTVAGTPGLRWAYPQNPNPYSPLGFDASFSTSGRQNFYAADTNLASDTTIARSADVILPPTPARRP